MIAASQNDFEEFGVDQSTLDEMKQVRGDLAGRRRPMRRFPSLSQPLPSFISLSRRAQSFSSSCCLLLSLFNAYSHRRGAAEARRWVVVSRPKAGLSCRAGSQSSGAPSVFGSLFIAPVLAHAPHILSLLSVALSCDAA